MLPTPQGRGVFNKVFDGRLRPEVQPLFFLYTFLPEKVFLSYTFYSLDIPGLELHIAFKCWKCTLFKIRINLKQERFLDFLTAINASVSPFGLLTHQNDRFPYPFTHFSKQRQDHVMERRSVTLFLFLSLETVLSDSTPENFAKIWQIKWNWTRSIKQCEFTFSVTFSVCCHPEILLPWQRDILTSPLHKYISFGSLQQPRQPTMFLCRRGDKRLYRSQAPLSWQCPFKVFPFSDTAF